MTHACARQEELLDPYTIEDSVVPYNHDLLLHASAFPNSQQYLFASARREDAAPAENALIRCKMGLLMSSDDYSRMVSVTVNVDRRGQNWGTAQYGSSHGNKQRANQRMELQVDVDRLLPACFEVDDDVIVYDKVKRRLP
jgi:hypothetical protein